MFHTFQLVLQYTVNGQKKEVKTEDCTDFWVERRQDAHTYRVVLHPKRALLLHNAYLVGEYRYTPTARIFVNGYQTWTTSREYYPHQRQRGLLNLGNLPPAAGMMRVYGDYNFQPYPRRAGVFHSYSYTYVCQDGAVHLLGTTNERTGYTVFWHDAQKQCLRVQKDVEGVAVTDAYNLFDLYQTNGAYDEVFDAYFATLALPPLRRKHIAGYTSWYNYYGAINEDILLRDLTSLSTVGNAADVFQIDDGYQTKNGDWQCNTAKFPHGMRHLSDAIHAKGYLAGLWMAPFRVDKDSDVARRHPDWLVRNANGKKQRGTSGFTAGWTLDFYQPQAAAHIRQCMRRATVEWGFDLLKLDFLYAVCQTPRYGKSRGQIMCEAMDFLRDCVGPDVYLLGCAVPLFPTFGVVDMCRISSDVGKRMRRTIIDCNGNQEIPGVRTALVNTVFRRHLNGRAFVNDSDVFYLRANNLRGADAYYMPQSRLHLTPQQKQLQAMLDNMLADVLFVSDNIALYDEPTRQLLLQTFRPTDKRVLDAYYVGRNQIEIVYMQNNVRYRLRFSLANGRFTVTESEDLADKD